MANTAFFDDELTYDTSGGDSTPQAFTPTLMVNPHVLIFHNKSDVSVKVGNQPSGEGYTFSPGQALVLDMVTNRLPKNETFTFKGGTTFYASSTAGTGLFHIGVIYSE